MKASHIQSQIAYLDQRVQKNCDAMGWAERQGDTDRVGRLRELLTSLQNRRAQLVTKAASLTTAADPVAMPSPPSLRTWQERSPVDLAEILVRSIARLTRTSLRGDEREQVAAIAAAAAVMLIELHDEEAAKRLERRAEGERPEEPMKTTDEGISHAG